MNGAVLLNLPTYMGHSSKLLQLVVHFVIVWCGLILTGQLHALHSAAPVGRLPSQISVLYSVLLGIEPVYEISVI